VYHVAIIYRINGLFVKLIICTAHAFFFSRQSYFCVLLIVQSTPLIVPYPVKSDRLVNYKRSGTIYEKNSRASDARDL
jgi:hypothetical protein